MQQAEHLGVACRPVAPTVAVALDPGRVLLRVGVRLQEPRGSRRERIEFEWAAGYIPGPVTLTESFGSVLLKAPSAAASSFFGGYALEGRQRERLTQRHGIANPADLYAMLREFGASIAGAVTVGDPDAATRTQPAYEPTSDGKIIRRLQRAANDGDLGSDDQDRSMRWPPSSGSCATTPNSSAKAPASTWSSSATTGSL